MRKAVIAVIAAAALLPLQPRAAPSVEDFALRTAEDLVDLCAVPDGDSMVEAARGFCYGFLSGAGSYQRAINAGANAKPLFCLPEKGAITRGEAARMYVAWARANPQHLKEVPVDNVIRFAVATWPCKQAKH
jgi:hypothetical protein